MADLSCAELLDRVEHLAPLIRDHSPAAEQARSVSPEVVDAMVEAGLYALFRPAAHGGAELDPVSAFRVLEAVAKLDSAAGWTLANTVGQTGYLGWLPDEGAAEILAGPALVTATSFHPPGIARRVAGGYRVRGRFQLVSGCRYATWFLFLAVVTEGKNPPLSDGGVPEQVLIFLPAEQVGIVDTWHSLGMRGTGSHDVTVEDVFVPAARAAAMAPPSRPGSGFSGPLYRLTVWPTIALIAIPALGVASAAIDDFVALARTKTPSFTGSALRDRQVVQRQVAQARAHIDAGRAFLHATFTAAWEKAVEGAPIELSDKLSMQLSITHAMACAARAVDLVCDAAGTSAIRDESPFGRHRRDVHTLTAHAFASAQRYESVGAHLLGAESDWGFFAF
ncbi:MAG: acyl-CoA dehydrogenase family protein [Sporichthyaceae bacterium]